MEKPTGNQCRRTRQTLFSEEVPEWVRSCLVKRCLSVERLCEHRYPERPPASAAQPLPDINSVFFVFFVADYHCRLSLLQKTQKIRRKIHAGTSLYGVCSLTLRLSVLNGTN